MVVAVLGAQDQPLFRASTRLVQVSVIVEDRDGRPVSGLTAKDFRIYDGNREQALELFLAAATPGVATPPMVSATPSPTGAERNVFTNRMDRARNVTVVLFDRLNTPANDQIYARQHLLEFLQQIKPDDRVGLYVLDPGTIRVLHDFTNDARSLVRALSRYQAVTSNETADLPPPEFESTGDAALDAELDRFLERAHENIAAHFQRLRGEVITAAFQAIANHLAGVEGRKNLVWVSAGLSLRALGVNPSAEIQRIIRPLNDANVSVYAIDARGLVGAIAWGPGGKPRFTTLSTVQDPQDLLQIAAIETGGRAFLNTNDINGAVRRAVDDARNTYTLGYYPNHAKWDGTYRPIKVQVNRPGVRVRHRKGYLAAAGLERVTANAAITSALMSPLEAVALELTARVERVAGASDDLRITIATAPGAVAFERSGDVWKGALDVVVAQKLADGTSQRSVDRRVDFGLRSDRYEAAQQSGFAMDVRLTLAPAIQNLHIVVHDLQSGATGSIIVPADRLRAIRP